MDTTRNGNDEQRRVGYELSHMWEFPQKIGGAHNQRRNRPIPAHAQLPLQYVALKKVTDLHRNGHLDFDEQTADDWDVDMSVYYEKSAGDMDSRDMLAMRREKKLREGGTERETRRKWRDNDVGLFEQHTKGIGRKIMSQQKKRGWRRANRQLSKSAEDLHLRCSIQIYNLTKITREDTVI